MTKQRTCDRLADDLTRVDAPQQMIERAKQGQYDDYLSDSASPIADLVRDARKAGLNSIAQKAMNGEYDATKEEADAWARSPEGQATFKEFFGKG